MVLGVWLLIMATAPSDPPGTVKVMSSAPVLVDQATSEAYVSLAGEEVISLLAVGPAKLQCSFRVNTNKRAKTAPTVTLELSTAAKDPVKLKIVPRLSKTSWRKPADARPSESAEFYIQIPEGPQIFEFHIKGGGPLGGALRVVDSFAARRALAVDAPVLNLQGTPVHLPGQALPETLASDAKNPPGALGVANSNAPFAPSSTPQNAAEKSTAEKSTVPRATLAKSSESLSAPNSPLPHWTLNSSTADTKLGQAQDASDLSSASPGPSSPSLLALSALLGGGMLAENGATAGSAGAFEGELGLRVHFTSLWSLRSAFEVRAGDVSMPTVGSSAQPRTSELRYAATLGAGLDVALVEHADLALGLAAAAGYRLFVASSQLGSGITGFAGGEAGLFVRSTGAALRLLGGAAAAIHDSTASNLAFGRYQARFSVALEGEARLFGPLSMLGSYRGEFLSRQFALRQAHIVLAGVGVRF